jgi:hypothetical protein
VTPDASGAITDSQGTLATVFGLADGTYVLTAKASLTGDATTDSRVTCDLRELVNNTVFDTGAVDVATNAAAEIVLTAAASLSGGPTDVVFECSTDVTASVAADDIQLMALRVGSVTVTGP